MADRQMTFGIRLKADGSGFVGEVRLAGDEVRKFGEATQQAGRAAEQASAQATQSAVLMGSAIGNVLGMAIGKAVEFGVQFAHSIAASVEAMGNLAITSERLQTSVEQLTKLDYVARLNDISSHALARSFRELNKDAFEAARGNENAAQQFRAVGIELRDQSGKVKDAQAMFLELADVVSSIENPVIKAAVATRFFGARGEELLPVLNKGSAGIREMYGEAEKFGAVVGTDAARAANEFNDNLTRLKITSEAWVRSIASDLIPTLNDMLEILLRARTAGQGSFTGAVAALKYAGKPAEELKGELNEVNQKLLDTERYATSLAGRFAMAFSRDHATEMKIEISSLNQQMQELLLGLAAAEEKARHAQAASNRRYLEDRAAVGRMEPGRGAPYEEIVAEQLRKPERPGRAERDRGAELESNIARHIEALQQEDEAGQKLTQSEQLRLKIEHDLADGKLTLTTRQMIAIDAGLEEWRTLELGNRAKQEEKRLLQEMARERERAIAAGEREAAQMERQVATFGMTRAQILDYEAAELEATAAVQKMKGALEEEIDATQKQAASKRQAAEAARQLATLNFERDLDKELQSIQDEITLLGASNAERAKAALLRKAEAEGIELTAAELEKINRIGATIELADQAKRVQQAIDDAAGAAAKFGEELVLNFRNAGDAVKQLEQDLLRIGTRALVTQPLEDFFRGLLGSAAKGRSIGGAGGGLFDSVGDWFIKVFGMHEGGIAGEQVSFTAMAPRALYARAPRFHSGGLAGNEIPAILQAGEEVITVRDPRHRANSGGAATIVNYNTFNVPAGTSRATAAQIGAGFARQLDILHRRAVTP